MHQSAARRTAQKTRSKHQTKADVLAALGNIPAKRVRFDVNPGRATERDLVKCDVMGEMPCELIDGFVVEKTMGQEESFLAVELIFWIRTFLHSTDLGYVSAPDGPFRVRRRLIRMPDVAFFAWQDRSKRTVPTDAVSKVAPDLAVEILSKWNTKAEIDRKIRDFFAAGVRLVWVINPKKRTAEVCTSPTDVTTLTAADSLDGGDVLPGFSLPLARLFAKLGPAGKGRKKSK